MPWHFDRVGFDKQLLDHCAHLEKVSTEETIQHIAECPRCLDQLTVNFDGKPGAARRVCANQSGFEFIPELNVSVQSGCLNFADSTHMYCRSGTCQPTAVVAAIPQLEVLDAVLEHVGGPLSPPALKYNMKCQDPDDESIFECLLPRSEVDPVLLISFERGRRLGHVKLRTPSGQGRRLRARGRGRSAGVAHRTSRGAGFQEADMARGRGRGASNRGGRDRGSSKLRAKAKASSAKATCSSRVRDGVKPLMSCRKRLLNRQVVRAKGRSASAKRLDLKRAFGSGCHERSSVPKEGWLHVDQDSLEGQSCPINKDIEKKLRRVTGGMITAVFPCGELLGWQELHKGESLQLVYALVFKVAAALRERGRRIGCLRYDNMCKLEAVVMAKKDLHLPLTRLLSEIPMLLDGLHRRNHTWCLKNRPHLDPENEDNKHLVENVNSQSAEQLNRFISERAHVAREMTRGRYSVYWWVMFIIHNRWLREQACAARRRFARGHMKDNPDNTRVRASTQSILGDC